LASHRRYSGTHVFGFVDVRRCYYSRLHDWCYRSTAVAALSNEPLSVAITQGIAVAVPVSLLMTQLDILGRSITTVFIHGADHYAETHNERGIVLMHWLGQLPWD